MASHEQLVIPELKVELGADGEQEPEWMTPDTRTTSDWPKHHVGTTDTQETNTGFRLVINIKSEPVEDTDTCQDIKTEPVLQDDCKDKQSGDEQNAEVGRSASAVKTIRSGPHRSFTCDVCCKIFKQESKYKRHNIIHSGERPFMCSVCCETFPRGYNLKLHKVFSCQRSFLQSPWRKPFALWQVLKRHGLIRSSQRRFLCEVCSMTYTIAWSLKKHKQTHTPTSQRSFVCDVCSKTFIRPQHLKTHKMTHTGEKPFVCDMCSKSFSQLAHLKRHKLVHTGQRPFVCNVCSKTFTQASNLKTHQRTHTGERPFVCAVCNKSFTDQSNLKTHQITHTGQKPFTCDECFKTFTQLSTLTRHKITHTGQRPFVCDVCDKPFTNRYNLKRHKKKSHDD